jgi:hypothetical protein
MTAHHYHPANQHQHHLGPPPPQYLLKAQTHLQGGWVSFPCLTVLFMLMLYVFVVMYQDIVDCKQKHAQPLFCARLFYSFLL